MSLHEKIEKYGHPHHNQNEFTTLGKEILSEIRLIVNDLKDDNALPEKTQENIKQLKEAFLKLPHTFFYNHPSDLLEVILDLSSENVYKALYDISFDLLKPANIEPQKNPDELVLFMLVRYLEKVPVKELLGYLKSYNEKKQKNPQLKLLIIELLHFVLTNIDKKELYLNEILPALLRTLNPSLAKYIKYKTKVDNNQYGETPKHIVQYLLNYENWAKSLLQKIMKSLVTVIGPHKGERRLLLINDIYEAANQTDFKRKTPSMDKIVTHYCVLFILDVFEGLIDCRGNAYFLKENVDAFIENVLKTLLEIHPNLRDYVQNFIGQLKMKQLDETIAMYNKKDEYNLPVGAYDKLTQYNPASVAYLAIRLIQNPKESMLLTAEYKLQLLLPCIHQIFSLSIEKHELKTEAMVCANNLLQSFLVYNKTSVENLNKFGVPLDKVVERVLDYTGSTVNEKDRSLGIDIFINTKKILTERSLARLLISAIAASRTHALYSYLVVEFKTGITNILKSCGSIEDIKEIVSPFLNAGYFRQLFEVGIDSKSPKFKDNSELMSSCINILTLIYMKLQNLVKNAENYQELKFKDPNNLFSVVNFKYLLDFGEKAKGLSKKVKDDVEMCKKQIDQMTKENPDNPNVQNYHVKINELLLISDSITRIEEIHNELKHLQKAQK